MSASRAARLVRRARETARAPRPARLAKPATRGYRVIGISLYTDQANWIDALTAQLQGKGLPKANRSMVVQQAIAVLAEAVEGRPAEDLVLMFQADRRLKGS